MQLTKALVTPYALSLYDDHGTRMFCNNGGGGTTYTASVGPPTNETATYTAYVAQGCPSPGPVTNDVKQSQAIAITNIGYSGTLTVTADTITTDANSPTANVTMALSKPLVSPYSLSLYDDHGARISCVNGGGGSTFTAAATPPTSTTVTYTAYVAQGCPSPGPVTNDVKQSQAITITNIGYTGTLTVTANKSETDANSPTANVTMALSKPIVSPYWVSLYDDHGARISCIYGGGGGSTFTALATPPTSTTVTYTAYVAQNCPSPGPPTSDVRQVNDVSITNVGWMGNLNVTVTGAATATLAIDLTKQLVSPYWVSVYDDQGHRAYCSGVTGVTHFEATVNPPNPGTRTYTVYVAQNCPADGSPLVDIRAADAWTFVNGAVTAHSSAGIDLAGLAAVLATLDAEELEADVLLAPGSHGTESSESDQALAFEAEREAGGSILSALLKAAAAGGAAAAAGWLLYLFTESRPAPPHPAPPTQPIDPPGPPTTDPYPAGGQPTYLDHLTTLFLERNPKLTEVNARKAADLCISTAQWQISLGLLSGAGNFPCEWLDIYLPGSEYPNVTKHDYDAIRSDPMWAVLHYVPSPVKETTPLARNWAAGQPECAGLVGGSTGKDCDEYPFFASQESGPGASLRPLDSAENRAAGGRYGVFVRPRAMGGCELEQGDPFLVLPMTFSYAPSTMQVCRPL